MYVYIYFLINYIYAMYNREFFTCTMVQGMVELYGRQLVRMICRTLLRHLYFFLLYTSYLNRAYIIIIILLLLLLLLILLVK